MPQTIKTIDDLNTLRPGDRFTVEYTVRNAPTHGRVDCVPVLPGSTAPYVSADVLLHRNGTITYRAPFVPKPGEKFRFDGGTSIYTLLFMDSKGYYYEDARGTRFEESRSPTEGFSRVDG